VRVAMREGMRADLELEVEDSGSGIPAEQIDKIFDPFHRVVTEGGEHTEGSGLGLSIVRRLVEAMGGRISVLSEVGKGSTFTAKLQSIEVAHTEPSEPVQRQTSVNFAALAPSRILIVDDVPLNRDLMAAYLADSGHELAFADNGLDAVDQVSRFKPTVVLMDIRMPLLDGRSAAHRIRQMEGGRNICLVAVTASSLSAGEHTPTQVFDAYLRKPVSPREVYDCLRELLGTRRDPEGCSLEGQAMHAREAKADVPLTPAQREAALPAVVELERLVLTRLMHVQSTMLTRDIKVLAEDIAAIGRRGDLSRITGWATRLQAAADSFDINTMDSLLDQLPRHVTAERNVLENS